MRIELVSQVFLILMLFFSTPAPFAQRKSGGRVPDTRLIGNVSGVTVADSCGCYFRFRNEDGNSERYVFFEDASKGSPLVNIGGRNVELKLISSTEPSNGLRRKGEWFSRRYASGAIKVRMDFVATSVCPSSYNPECVANSYDVMLTVIKGARRQTIKAVGGCGC
jgi:hypothetical protein